MTSPDRDTAPSDRALPDPVALADLLKLEPSDLWQPEGPYGQVPKLRIPIGVDSGGRPLALHLEESRDGAMGPHGLVVGTSGSGREDLLRAVVTGMAATHSSQALNIALVDFHDGAAFAGLTGLPQVSAAITHLADDLTLVDRMIDMFHREFVRRQELLRYYSVSSAYGYETAVDKQGEDGEIPPWTRLLVIFDGVSDLLTARPDAKDLFVEFGRLGRYLGVHLLLSMQQMPEGLLRGVESHLSYRIALRTASEYELRMVVGGKPGTRDLPLPGSAYLKTGVAELVWFRTALVSDELIDTIGRRQEQAGPRARQLWPPDATG